MLAFTFLSYLCPSKTFDLTTKNLHRQNSFVYLCIDVCEWAVEHINGQMDCIINFSSSNLLSFSVKYFGRYNPYLEKVAAAVMSINDEFATYIYIYIYMILISWIHKYYMISECIVLCSEHCQNRAICLSGSVKESRTVW